MNKKQEQLETMRHSAAHLMAAAVQELYPAAKFGIGPVIENGFYYDFDLPAVLIPDDFKKIEKKMKELQRKNLSYERQEMKLAEAINFFKKIGQDYKVELLNDLKKRGTTMVVKEEEVQEIDIKKPDVVSVYKTGEFIDLCRGPHVNSTKEIKEFKLERLAGAYWRGDEKNKMLQRIYGLAFDTKKELADYLTMREEARKRDHRKLGPELDLFTFSELVGPGLPLWTPKGTIMRDVLDDYVWQLRKKAGYQKVEIPHITKKDLYETSGHWEKFKDELFKINTREGYVFALKPMNCPHHTQIYKHLPRSYRDLPQRYANTTMVYRDEQTGELSGLSRVRCITQDDAHVFCRSGQVKEEFLKIWDIIDTFYQAIGFEKLKVRLSFHDPANFDKYLGTPVVWREAERNLRTIAKAKKVKAEEAIGEAAFYGPKVDFMAKDSIGREWQVATIQLDMNMPERFDLTCVNEKGKEERIVMIHAAIMGSLERFLSVIIEHFAGAFPVWLAPVQAAIASVGSAHQDFAQKLADQLAEAGFRVETDFTSETVSNKIRKAEHHKIPYMLVIGDKEAGGEPLAVRIRGRKKVEIMTAEEFIARLKRDVVDKRLF